MEKYPRGIEEILDLGVQQLRKDDIRRTSENVSTYLMLLFDYKIICENNNPIWNSTNWNFMKIAEEDWKKQK